MMNKIAILVGGKAAAYINSPDDFQALKAHLVADGIVEGSIDLDADSLGAWHANTGRETVRVQIADQTGDDKTILGIQADMIGILLAYVLADITSLGDHASNEAQRTRLAIMQALAGADVDIVALAKSTLAKIQNGDVILTAALKGLPSVIEDALINSTKVANILIAAQKGNENA